MKKRIITIGFIALVLIIGLIGIKAIIRYINENRDLKQIVLRLEADSRIAEVLVTNIEYSEMENRKYTTIKFLEYNTKNKPLEPRYFTFPGNVLQFQSLVVRFDDNFVRMGDKLKGKSVYFFWKIFMLDDKNTKVYDLTKVKEIPGGYKLQDAQTKAEEKFWAKFWEYALNSEKAEAMGIKNAQIEAPGTMFVPGTLYTIKIEHDGGMRIDAKPLPAILRGERI